MSNLSYEDKKKFIFYFKGEAKREVEYAEQIKRTSDKSVNPIIRLIMEAVSQDSIKHSKIYETLSKIIESPQLIGETESLEVLKDMESHIKLEQESVDELKRLIDDPRFKNDKPILFLLNMLLRDELFHHAILLDLYETLIKKITLTETDIWDQVWNDALYHGAPGG
ncbi:MAG: hypothetical protein ACP5I6_04450 [Caldisphaera sp.]|jgi:rubrerythrin